MRPSLEENLVNSENNIHIQGVQEQASQSPSLAPDEIDFEFPSSLTTEETSLNTLVRLSEQTRMSMVDNKTTVSCEKAQTKVVAEP